MHVNFSRFLLALAVVGVSMGAVFGVGVAVGRSQRPAAALASNAQTGGSAAGATGASGAAAAGASGTAAAGQGGGFGAFGAGAGAGGVAPVSGAVDAVTATSMTVKTANGETVTVTLNPQTAVRKLEAGGVQDIKAGDQVLVTRDASSVATNVQIVPPGTAVGGPRGGAGTPAAGSSATPSASGTPRRGQ